MSFLAINVLEYAESTIMLQGINLFFRILEYLDTSSLAKLEADHNNGSRLSVGNRAVVILCINATTVSRKSGKINSVSTWL